MGLGSLTVSTSLTASAEWKSLHMAAYSYLAHDDPAPPVGAPWRSASTLAAIHPAAAGWGENIAYYYPDAASVMARGSVTQATRRNRGAASWKRSGSESHAAARADLLDAGFRSTGPPRARRRLPRRSAQPPASRRPRPQRFRPTSTSALQPSSDLDVRVAGYDDLPDMATDSDRARPRPSRIVAGHEATHVAALKGALGMHAVATAEVRLQGHHRQPGRIPGDRRGARVHRRQRLPRPGREHHLEAGARRSGLDPARRGLARRLDLGSAPPRRQALSGSRPPSLRARPRRRSSPRSRAPGSSSANRSWDDGVLGGAACVLRALPRVLSQAKPNALLLLPFEHGRHSGDREIRLLGPPSRAFRGFASRPLVRRSNTNCPHRLTRSE